jgi:2,4-dienoyl-CoA reductase-like NADH-dependent reductase (Old Yellow Enzyme family)/NADH dehydrogenase FAD-containing subunit
VSAFPNLLAPGAIGTLELRNRILMAPMGDSLANPDGTVSDAQLAYFEARARGGAALLLIGSVAVAYPDGCVDERQVAASHDDQLPGLRALAERVHAHGARLAAQLTYNGALARLDIARGRPMLVPAIPARPHPDALSMMLTDAELAGFAAPYASPNARVEYRVADDEDLAGVVQRFVDAADRCRRAGLDGVELHAGHGYLVDEFLSPSINDRTDAWGGDVDGRSRLLVEIIRATRARLGDFPLWMRINAVEHHKPDGERFDEQLRVIERAVAAGLDAVHVTAYASMDVATGPTDSYAPHRVGTLSDYARAVRAEVAVPVITFGRFEPDEAEAVLADGRADFVAMGRKLLADPDLPNKLAAGVADRIRPCLYQYRCIGNIFVNESLACVANAATGREDVAALPEPARRQRLLVAGAGAAGLETARVLALQGHTVEVHERADALGGVLDAVGAADPVLARYREWLRAEAELAGVRIVTGREVTVETVRDAGLDAVIVATGPTWSRPEVAGASRVRTPPELSDVLADGATPPEAVAIRGGGTPGLTLASALRARGSEVALVEATKVFGTELGLPGRWRMVADAEAAGVTLLPDAEVTAVTPTTVELRRDGCPVSVPAALVITTRRVAGAPALAEALRATGIPTHVVGDALEARGFEGITRDAEDTARALARTD